MKIKGLKPDADSFSKYNELRSLLRPGTQLNANLENVSLNVHIAARNTGMRPAVFPKFLLMS
jgi:hypothetical protein